MTAAIIATDSTDDDKQAESLSTVPNQVRTSNDQFISFLLERKDAVFYRKPYPGNSGDSLIYKGTGALLTDLEIKQTLNPHEADIILIPGGNPSMWPGSGARLWKRIWHRFPTKEFIVGPAGFQSNDVHWKNMVIEHGGRVTGLFARDPLSYGVLSQAEPAFNRIAVGLSHDTALYLHNSEWLRAHTKTLLAMITYSLHSETITRLQRIVIVLSGLFFDAFQGGCVGSRPT